MQPTRSEMTALGAALAPFVIHFGDSYRHTVNGQVVTAYDYNYAGVLFGVVAIVLAVQAYLKLHVEGTGQYRAVHMIGIAGIVALALYQIARGASLLA